MKDKSWNWLMLKGDVMTVSEDIRPSTRTPIESVEDAPEPYTREQFASLAGVYLDLRMELTKEGKLIIMPPSGDESSHQNRFG